MTTQTTSLPKTTSLFRFLRIKNPEIVSSSQTRHRFIANMVESSSVFLDAIDGLETQEAIDSAVLAVLDDFTPLKSTKEVKNISTAVYEFGEWLSDPATDYSLSAAITKSLGITALTGTQLNTAWDNLYYQALTTESQYTRDAILKLIKGNHFLAELALLDKENPTPADVEKFERLSQASVLIEGKLVAREPAATLQNDQKMDAYQKKALLKLQNADIARFNIARYEKALEEIKDAKRLFESEVRDEVDSAIKEHNDTVRELITGAPLDPTTGEPQYPQSPAFTFSTTAVFDESFLEGKISQEAIQKYTDMRRGTRTKNVDVIETLEADIVEQYKRLGDNVTRNRVVKAYEGLALAINERPANNSFALSSVKLYDNQDLYSLVFTQYFDTPDTKIKELDVNVSNGGSVYPYSTKKVLSESDTHVSYLLFPQGITVNTEVQSVNFNATYKLQNLTATGAMTATGVLTPYTDVKIPADQDGIPGNDKVSVYGVTKVGIGEFKRVEQELCCYVPGEVSHIENIMAREYKEKSTRNLTRTEDTTEETTEREVEDLSDTTSTDRYEMQTEISRVLQEDQSLQLGASTGVQGTYPGGSYNVNANMNYTSSSSSTNSFNEAETYAKEVTERAMQRIVEKVSSKRTSRMLREYEETNKHGFDNREGDRHVTGIYRWVDKIYKNTLMNYGKRLMYDFMLPEPAKNFKYWMTKEAPAQTQVEVLVEPVHPKTYGILTAANITRANYTTLAGEYGADVDAPQPTFINVGKGFADMPVKTGAEFNGRHSGGYAFSLEIPDGYACYSAAFSYGHDYAGTDDNGLSAVVSVAGRQHFTNNRVEHVNFYNSPFNVSNIEKELEISVSGHDIGSFNLNVMAYCGLKHEVFQAWQAQTYLAIMEAYNEKLAEFKKAKAAVPVVVDPGKTDYNFNPLIGRSIEQRELKRMCIELMTKPFGFNMGQNQYTYDFCADNHKINRTPAFEKYASHARFFEEAFDWEIMAYMFYPYFWAEERTWGDLIKEKSSADYIFQAFLQSGMGRVTVPVRAGYEKAVLYFLDTGKVWLGKGFTVDLNSELYQSIDQLLVVKEGVPEATWLTRIPSALTIIQNDSAPLDENGLPCHCCEDGTPLTCSPMAEGTSLMQGSGSGSGGGTSKNLMEFDADPSLTLADIGKIVVNVDEKAKVSNATLGNPGQTGRWEFNFDTVLTPPAQAKYKLQLSGTPLNNDSFTLAGKPFKFVNTITGAAGEIEIGSTLADTLANMVTELGTYSTYLFQSIAIVGTDIEFLAGTDFPNSAGNTMTFDPLGSPVTRTLVTSGTNGHVPLLSNAFMEYHRTYDGTYTSGTVYFENVMSASAPNGTLVSGYKWPANGYELAQNLLWYLNGEPNFNTGFICTEVDATTFRIEELNIPEIAAEVKTLATMVDVFGDFTVVQTSQPAVPDLVYDVVLGVLEQLNTTTGKAYINVDRLFKVKLAAGVDVSFDPSAPLDPSQRLLMYGDNGEVVRFQEHLPEIAALNGFMMALEEGASGDRILVEKMYIFGN